jgi:hypothetical protein
MVRRFNLLRRRVGQFTVTPARYALAAYAALGAFTLIVLSGAAAPAQEPRAAPCALGALELDEALEDVVFEAREGPKGRSRGVFPVN